ncbi:hypothetical protein RRG08_036450 [Elysia crispata]|uniref:Uncharacterized protein n=1 Tax=Elysia crispata TaxID=231223 RepID=A0AAE1DIC0_9GAST|nr:hypothetical protein RRG08_036450 [Elysia crispata]
MSQPWCGVRDLFRPRSEEKEKAGDGCPRRGYSREERPRPPQGDFIMYSVYEQVDGGTLAWRNGYLTDY